MVLRYDQGSLGTVTRTPQGGIRVAAAVARVGVLSYRNADGSERRELRLPEDVFHADSMASLAGAPVTDLHPPELVSPGNYRTYAAGHVAEGSARQDGDLLVADLVVQAGDVADLILTGARKDVSCGYVCELEESSGEYQGERYDFIQRNIRQNHVALGPSGWGRSGSAVSLRLDSAGDGLPPRPEVPPVADTYERIDGVDYPVGTPPHDAAVKRRDAAHAALQARADVAESQIAALQKRVDELEAEVKDAEASADRKIELMRVADGLGVEVPEGADESAIMMAVVKKAHPDMDLEGKSPEYLAAAYDLAVDSMKAAPAVEARGDGRRVQVSEVEAARQRLDAAYKKSIEAATSAWRN
jgi:hypothetical protein